MAKIYDLEKEKQKAKERLKEAPHPLLSFTSKDGNLRVYPMWEKGPDGEWRIKNPERLKTILGYDQKENDQEEEPT